jgi:hypothetical protein
LEIIDLDDERRHDVSNGNGFIISAPKAIKDDIKDDNGIFSSRYGTTLQDISPFEERYRCKCGNPALRGKFNVGRICEICHSPVQYVGDNFSYTGWMTLKDPYYIIHPNLYMNIATLIGGTVFDSIIQPNDKIDEDGNEIQFVRPKEEPFKNIGLIEFHDRFDEIIDFYIRKRPDKKPHYDLIMENRDKVFTQSIPAYTTHLRPYRLEGGELNYEGTNAILNMMAHLVAKINDDKLKINRKTKPKLLLLYNLQMQYKELTDEIDKILSGKKGTVRTLIGGRFNFTARSVIAPDRTLRSDQVRLSYHCLCGLLQQVIINILHRTYNMQYHAAYKYLYENTAVVNQRIKSIIEGLIKSNDGIDIIINRN